MQSFRSRSSVKGRYWSGPQTQTYQLGTSKSCQFFGVRKFKQKKFYIFIPWSKISGKITHLSVAHKKRSACRLL